MVNDELITEITDMVDDARGADQELSLLTIRDRKSNLNRDQLFADLETCCQSVEDGLVRLEKEFPQLGTRFIWLSEVVAAAGGKADSDDQYEDSGLDVS